MAGLVDDYALAKQVKLRPILEIAGQLKLPEEFVEPYGRHKAKIRLDAVDALAARPMGKYVIVTAITPTPLGEGKTVNTIGVSLGLNRIGKRAACCLRQPSLGPVFGVKGGATGGGRSQVLPMEDINFHLTGDIHAVQAAHNLGAAFLDNHLHHGNACGIDPAGIFWRRSMDMNDRALRHISIDRGGKAEREDGFDITAASEIMAILALARSHADLRQRLGRMILARTKDGSAVTADRLKVAGSMALLLRHAILPNLLQTIEGTPAFVHAGPFGNIAHGNSSILADLVALRCSDFVVTEAGFGADLGFEKFVDIKCRTSGLRPDAAVVVATVRALKVHSGKFTVVPGKPLPEKLLKEDAGAVAAGAPNLAHMISIVHAAGLPAVVAINRFPQDGDREIEAVREAARAAGAEACEVSDVYAKGGAGAEAIARRLVELTARPSPFRFLYDADQPIRAKIEILAKKVYGADGVDCAPLAKEKIALFEKWGLSGLPICMAKSHLSISHDPALKGRPTGWRLPIQDVRASAGAGFLYPLCGSIMTMPGLSAQPAGEMLDIDARGDIVGMGP